MRKIILFSLFLICGLFASQVLPDTLGKHHTTLKLFTDNLLFLCLSFIMINVGREFVLDKTKMNSYRQDYFIAMATAAAPWIFICIYYMLVLMPEGSVISWDAWKENLLMSRFAAPTSAGILFTMLAAAGLKKRWIYRKVQVLAIFDDLDTILLMIPLQIIMIGFKWQLLAIVLIVTLLLWIGWKYMNRLTIRQEWQFILLYATLTLAATHAIYHLTKHYFGEEGAVHIEVLLPAFVMGMIMEHKHHHSRMEDGVASGISYLFMFLVGLSMPHFVGGAIVVSDEVSTTMTASMPMLGWGAIAFHVVVVSLLSNIGKLFPMFFYRDRPKRERLALSVGMFTRGEVGAAIIFLALGYNLGGPILIISVLTIAFNLILTGFFVAIVRKLSLSVYNDPRYKHLD